MGEKDELKTGVSEDVYLTLSKGDLPKLKAQIEIGEELTAPITAGSKIGDVIYMADEKEVARVDLVALEDVEQGSLFKRLWDWVKRLVFSWF